MGGGAARRRISTVADTMVWGRFVKECAKQLLNSTASNGTSPIRQSDNRPASKGRGEDGSTGGANPSGKPASSTVVCSVLLQAASEMMETMKTVFGRYDGGPEW